MKRKSIAKNYVYNLIYQLLTVISPLITAPYLSRVLGAENLGIHGFTMSIATYFILFGSLGIAMYGQREIAYVQDDIKKRSNIFFELIIIRFITYIFSMGAFYFVFCSHGDYATYYKILLLEMAANAIDIAWYFQGTEEFKKTVLRNLIVKILGLVFVFVFIKKPDDLVKYFFIYVIFDLLGNASLWLYLKNEVVLNFKQLKFKKHILPMILLFLPQVAVQIYTVLDKTMVGILTNSMTEVGYYDQAQKLVKAFLTIVTALGLVMNARIANSYAKRDEKAIKNYMIQSFSMVWLIAIPLVFGIIAVSDKFIPWYLGEEFLPVIPLMCATSPILLIIGLSNVTGIQYLIQVGKQSVFTASVFIGALSNAILNFILIKKIGTVGAVYSSVIAEIIILLFHFYCIRKKISIMEVLKLSIKNILAGIVMYIAVRFVTIKFPISIWYTLVEVIIGGVIYCVVLLILRDKFFMNMIKRVFIPIKNRIKVK